MTAEMATRADLSEIEDQIVSADTGDYDQLLDVCASIVNVLKDLNSRIGSLEDRFTDN